MNRTYAVKYDRATIEGVMEPFMVLVTADNYDQVYGKVVNYAGTTDIVVKDIADWTATLHKIPTNE